jgi:hypothetical protein
VDHRDGTVDLRELAPIGRFFRKTARLMEVV